MGEILVRNTAQEKYLVAMSNNCQRAYEPFDPTVANSPLISTWVPMGNGCNNQGNCETSNTCIPIYAVDAKTIDDDPVMNKVLDKPYIAMDLLVNIYNNAKASNTLRDLKGTRIYNFFMSKPFQKAAMTY